MLALTERVVSFFVHHVLASATTKTVSTSWTLRLSCCSVCGRGTLRTCPHAPNVNASTKVTSALDGACDFCSVSKTDVVRVLYGEGGRAGARRAVMWLIPASATSQREK